MAKPIKVLIHSDLDNGAILIRHSPGRKQKWGNVIFVFDSAELDYVDWVVICHSSSLNKPITVRVDPKHVVFISMEPPAWGKPIKFFGQFSHIVTCDSHLNHSKVIQKNGITWWAGLRVKFENGHKISSKYIHDYDSFSNMAIPEKKNRISIITSGNKSFPGHHKRLRFIEKLKKHPISKHIDFYGGYINPIEDKLDGLLEYKYHIALENSSIPDYWTEKFADPLLAFSMPIYYGCTNIVKYFPSGSYININIDDFDNTVLAIEDALENDLYSQNFNSLLKARKMVLNDYNILQLISEICTHHANQVDQVILNPLDYFTSWRSKSPINIIKRIGSFWNN